jgi:hypothetical protein
MKMKSKASLRGRIVTLVGLIRLCRRWVRSGDRRNSVLRVPLWHIVSGRYRYAYGSLSDDDDGVVTVDLIKSEWLVLRLVGAG